MNRLIIGIVGIAALVVVIGTQVLAALGKTPPEGLQHTADLCLGGLIGIATSETTKLLDAKKEETT
jgi:hypothetical protein